MAKNIILVTGSVRKIGNSSILASSFIKGARTAGHAVQRFDSANLKISAFRDKENAWRKGKPSLIEDHFNSMAPYLHVTDVLVLATPVYFGGFSSSLKLFIDNLYAYLVPNRRRSLNFKKAVLLAVARDNDEDTFDGVIYEFKALMKHFEITDYEIITVGGVDEREEILGNDALNQANELGKNI